MEKLFELLGRKQAQLEQLDGEYTKLTSLLAQVVKGEVARSRVLVNLTDRTWMLVPEGTRPAMPATINGLPECVVAPNESGVTDAPEAIHSPALPDGRAE